jgi:2-keto-4-pentenoate hydratase/2-oxohepta-3-ene-1,7-dioic acid hydratase in catechol pathway
MVKKVQGLALLLRQQYSFTISRKYNPKIHEETRFFSSSSAALNKMTTTTISYAFEPHPIPSIPIATASTDAAADSTTTAKHFPVHRIYCVGQNYAEHAREMGCSNPDRDAPFFFTKPADAIVPVQSSSSSSSNSNNDEKEPVCRIPYPLATENLHYE